MMKIYIKQIIVYCALLLSGLLFSCINTEPQPNQFSNLKPVNTITGTNTTTGINTTTGTNTLTGTNTVDGVNTTSGFFITTTNLDLSSENGKYVFYIDESVLINGNKLYVNLLGSTVKLISVSNATEYTSVEVYQYSSSLLGVTIPFDVPIGDYYMDIWNGKDYYRLPKTIIVKNPKPDLTSIVNTTITAGANIEVYGKNLTVNGINKAYLVYNGTSREITNITFTGYGTVLIPTEASNDYKGSNEIRLANATSTFLFTTNNKVVLTTPTNYPRITSVSSYNPTTTTKLTITGLNLKTVDNSQITQLEFVPIAGGTTLVKSPDSVSPDGTTVIYTIPSNFPTANNFNLYISVDFKETEILSDIFRVPN